MVNSGPDKIIPYPPGSMPEKDINKADEQEVKGKDSEMSQCRTEGLCSRILEDAKPTDDHFSSGVRATGHELKKEVLSCRY